MNVFISHASGQKSAASALASCLEARGDQALLDVGAGDSGQTSTEALADALGKAEAVVVLVGDEASTRQRREWRLALEESWNDPGLRIVPVVLGEADVPGWLRRVDAVRVASDGAPGARWDEVLDAIDHPPGRSTKPAEEWRDRLDEVVRRADELEGSAS